MARDSKRPPRRSVCVVAVVGVDQSASVLTRVAKVRHASRENASLGPCGSLLSRTATVPGRLATSTQAPPLPALRRALRHVAPSSSISLPPSFGSGLWNAPQGAHVSVLHQRTHR